MIEIGNHVSVEPLEGQTFSSFNGVVVDRVGDMLKVEDTDGNVWGMVRDDQCSVIPTQEDEEADIFDEPAEMSDMEADADTLKSAGMGTDEDYGGDSHEWES